MSHISQLRAALFTAISLLLPLFCWSANGPLPKADEILKKTIERAQWEKKNKLEEKWASSLRTIQENLDKAGKVEDHEERFYQPVLIRGKVFSKLVEKNGKPLSTNELKKEIEREKKFREAVPKPGKPDDDDIELNEELIARYNFNVIAREQINGRTAYLLTFLPRTGVKLATKRFLDRILNRLEGRVWVDAERYALLKVDMHLTEPITLMGGLGSIRSLEFLMEMAPIAPEVYAPRELKISYEGRKLFSGMRVNQQTIFTDYRKASELTEATD